jgi:hypothetical protein
MQTETDASLFGRHCVGVMDGGFSVDGDDPGA